MRKKKKNASCNLSLTSLKSTRHCFIAIHNWGWLVCYSFTALGHPSFNFSQRVGRVSVLFSPLSHFFPPVVLTALLFLESSLLPVPRPPPPPPPFPPPPLLNQLWPSSLSCSSVSPFFLSRVGGHTWVQYDGSSFIPPSLLLMHEPVSSHSAAPHLSLYYFTSFIVSFPPPLCCSYRTLTFSQFLSSLLFHPISSAFLSLSTFHLHSFNSEKSSP